MSVIGGIISTIVSPVTTAIGKYQDRKKAYEDGLNAIAASKQNGENEVRITAEQADALRVTNESTTWKDEFVTVVVMSPIVGIIFGAIWQAMSGDPVILTGTLHGVKELKSLGLDWGNITEIVVYAAVGVTTIRKFIK